MSTTSRESLQNPRLQLPQQLELALDEIRTTRLDALTRRNRVVAESRPTAEERQQIRTLDRQASPVEPSASSRLLASYRDRVSALEWPYESVPLAPVYGDPEARASDFWWGRTQWFFGGGLRAENRADGLHFFGRVNYDRDPLFRFSVGAWATFWMQPERRPHSPSGRYSSAPHVSLFGNINGWTNLKHCPWACDDKWCKCFLFLRQSAIQFVDDHGTWRLCGEATSHRTLINEEGRGVGVTAALPGFLRMPFLSFTLLRPDRDLLVDLEVRFDIELEGDSFIGFSPGDNPDHSVVLGYSQWPCVAS